VVVVKIEMRYNSIMHKTQPQKLVFFFSNFFGGSHAQNSTLIIKTNTLKSIKKNHKNFVCVCVTINNMDCWV